MNMDILKIPAAITAIMAFGAIATACAEHSADTETVTVTAKEFAFQPATISAKPGQTLRIKLVNEGKVSHNLHIAGSDAKTETIQAGNSDTIEFTVPEKGETRFFCAVPGHEQSGMVGRVVTDR